MRGEPDEVEVSHAVTAGIGASWFPVTATYARTYTQRWHTRGRDYADAVRDLCGMDDEAIATRLSEDEDLADALESGARKAVGTKPGVLTDGLARLAAAGLKDTARVDETVYLTSILVQLEPVHLRVLSVLAAAEDRLPDKGTRDVGGLAEAFGVPKLVGISAAQRLYSLGLVTDRLRGEVISWAQDPSTAFFLPSPLGRAVLRVCEAALDEGES